MCIVTLQVPSFAQVQVEVVLACAALQLKAWEQNHMPELLVGSAMKG